MFFLVRKNATSDRPIALLRTLIRWWEWLRAPVLEEWRKESGVRWDAAEGSNGAAERTAWEALLDMEK